MRFQHTSPDPETPDPLQTDQQPQQPNREGERCCACCTYAVWLLVCRRWWGSWRIWNASFPGVCPRGTPGPSLQVMSSSTSAVPLPVCRMSKKLCPRHLQVPSLGAIPTTLPAASRGTIHTVSFRSIHSQYPHSPHPYSFQHRKEATWSFTPRQIVVISEGHFQKQCTQSMLYATMRLIHFLKTHHCGMFTHPYGSSVFVLEK